MCRQERMVLNQVVELDDGQGDGGDQTRRSSAPTWKRRKRKTKKTKVDQGKGIN